MSLERRKPGPKPAPLSERLAAKTERTETCWNWTGTLDAYGYGQMTVSAEVTRSRKLKAHRVSWILAHGQIPSGLHILHRCDNRRCVRPDHLFLGDQADNMRDAIAKGRHINQTRAA